MDRVEDVRHFVFDSQELWDHEKTAVDNNLIFNKLDAVYNSLLNTLTIIIGLIRRIMELNILIAKG
jgi:hypothetical protein